MKIKVLAITALLCCLYIINAFGAPEDNFKVLQRGTDRTEIEVIGDCDIVVSDIAPDGKNKIYGDKVGDIAYGGTSNSLFNKNQVIPNGSKPGIQIIRDKDRVLLRVHYKKLQDAEIQIVSAEYKDSLHALPGKKGFFPGNSFTISLKKGGMEENGGVTTCTGDGASMISVQTVDNTFDIKKLKSDVETLNQEVSQLKKRSKDSDKEFDILSLLIALLIGLLIGYFLYRQNRKVLKELSKECSDLKEKVDKWEMKKNVQIVSHQTTLQKSKEKNSMTDEDIKRFIVEQIKSLQTQLSPSTLQPSIATNSNVDPIANPVKKVKQATDTDNVKYHQDDNSFSLEQTDIKIFRIYSKKGEYYYTIVDDSAVREELIGMLQMFEGCITYQTTDGVAKRVEPVTEGKLRKEGNKFYVDANNKLVVKFA